MNKKFLSFLLALCMILGMVPFTFAASAEDGETTTVTEYYVKAGGEGDGRSFENPAADVETVIRNINTDGHTTGDTVTVYVIPHESQPTLASGTEIDVNNFNVAPFVTSNVTSRPLHSATIKITTYNYTDGGTMAALSLGPLSTTDPVNAYKFDALGDEIFENIAFIDVRIKGQSAPFYADGHNLSFSNIKVFDVDDSCAKLSAMTYQISSQNRSGSTNSPSAIGDGGKIVVNGHQFSELRFSGWYDANTTKTVANDVTYELNNDSSATTVKLVYSNSSSTTNYQKNVNLVLNNSSNVTYMKDSGSVHVNGAIQIVLNNSSMTMNVASGSVTDTNGNATPIYKIDNKTSAKLDVTATAGIFSHTSTDTIYAYNDGNVIYSAAQSANLTVPAGEWNVTTSFDTAKGDKVDQDGGYKWVNENGTYTYKYEGTVGTKTYYAMFGGAGTKDGSSLENASDDIGALINKIEADASASDGVIYVKNITLAEGENYFDGTNTHKYLSWTRPNEHKKVITIKGYNDDNTNVLAGFATAGTGDLNPHGPLVFENITLFGPRECDEGFMTGGYDMTIGQGVLLKRTSIAPINYDWTFPADTTLRDIALGDGDSGRFIKLGLGRKNPDGKGGTLTLDFTPVVDELRINADYSTGGCLTAVDYTEDTAVNVKSLGNKALKLVLGFGIPATYEKNFNIFLNEVSKFTFEANNTVTVKGNMNIISTVAATVPASNLTVEGNTYVLHTDSTAAGKLSLTDDAGKFAVSDSAHVYAYGVQSGNRVAYHSVDGILTVPAGEWKVTTNVETARAYFVDVATWTENSDGTISYTYAEGYTPGTYYVMKDGDGNGLTKETAMGSVASAIAAIEADNGVTEGTIVIMNNPAYGSETDDRLSWFPKYKYQQTSEGSYEKVQDSSKKPHDSEGYLLNATTNYTAWDANSVKYTKHITIKGDADDTYLATMQTANSGDLAIGGPTTFTDIKILTLRARDEGIQSNGYDLTLMDTVGLYQLSKETSGQPHKSEGDDNYYYYFDGHTPALAPGERSSDSYNFIHFGEGRNQRSGNNTNGGNGGKLTVNAKSKIAIDGDICYYGTTTTATYSNNAELNVDTNGNAFVLNLARRNSTDYQKNLNLVFGNISSLTVTANNDVTVKGALQVIHPDNVTFTKPEKVFVNYSEGCGLYDITAPAGLLSTTETAGTYKVNDSSKTVYAYDIDTKYQSKVYVSVDGTLTVPYNGEYVVKTALDDVKAVLGDVDFYDDGNGTLTVVKIVKGTYYVMYGGDDKASGTTPNAPLASTAKAIELIEENSTLTEGTIIVMNNPAYKTSGYWQNTSDTKADNKNIYYLAWTPKSHKKPITVRGFDDNSTTGLAIAQTAYNVTGDLTIMGPTTFDNLFILRHRGYDEGLATCGYDVTFTDSVLFKQLYGDNTYDMYYGIPKNATLVDAQTTTFGSFIKLGSGRAASSGKGGTLKVDTDKAFQFETDWKSYTYENTVGFDIDTNGKNLTITWANGTGANVVYEKNLNIALRKVGTIANYMGTTINYKKDTDGKVVYENGVAQVESTTIKGTVTVEGDLQIIHNDGVSFDAVPKNSYDGKAATDNFIVKGKTYEILDDECLIEATDETLVFKVTKPTIVQALLDGEYENVIFSNNNRVLDLTQFKDTEQKIIVTEVEPSNLVTVKFPADSGFETIYFNPDDIANLEVALPALENEPYREFKGWKVGEDGPYTTLYDVKSYLESAYSGNIKGQTVTFTEAVYGEYTDTRFVFLDATNGDDSNNGSSKETAVKTLKKAFELLNAITDANVVNRKLVVIGQVTVGDFPENSKMITICGYDNNSVLFNEGPWKTKEDDSGNTVSYEDNGDDIAFSGDIKIENISIKMSATQIGNSKFIFSRDHKLIIGEGVTNVQTRPNAPSGQSTRAPLGIGVTHPNQAATVGKSEAVLNSGIFDKAYVGAQYVATNDTVSVQGVDVTIGGATVTELIVGGSGYSGRQGNSIFTDNVKITVDSGTLSTVTLGGYQGAYASGVNFILLNNAGKTTVASGITDKFGADNTYVVTTEKAASDGTYLKMTDTLGTYNVVGGMIAVATKADGTKVVSIKNGDSHTLTLGACTATVTYVEKMEYVYNFGKNFATTPDTLEIFNLPEDFDITDIEPVIHEGYYFEGWERTANGDGSAVTDSNKYDTENLAFGDKFKAVYTEYSTKVTDGDFKILGIQLRLAGENNKEVEQGLRYVVDLQDSFKKALNDLNTSGEVAYGTLVLPTDLTHGHTMKIDPKTANTNDDSPKGMPLYNEYEAALPIGDGSEYRPNYSDNSKMDYMEKEPLTTWTSGSWKSTDGPSVVPGKKTFSENNNGTQYTVCLTGINEANYGRHYSVTGYAVYTDRNGNRRAVYTDYYQTNLYLAAKAVNADTNGAHWDDKNVTDIIDYYENTRVTEFEADYYGKRDDMTTRAATGYVSYKTAVQDAKSAELTYVNNKGFYLYQDGINSHGVLVNEVEFNFFGSDDTVFTVIEAGDTHLNSVNDKDWANQESCILATYKGRDSGRSGSSVYNINSLMNFASHYDQLVIAGDVLDYFSYGCAEMVKKLIIDRDKNAMVLMGNHEDTVHMQNVNHTCPAGGAMTTTDTWAELVKEGIWESEDAIKYQSKILEKDGKKVMLIGIDSSDHHYSTYGEYIKKRLTADIETARAGVEGVQETIPIILFQHVPLNPNRAKGEEWLPLYYGSADTGGTETRDGVYKCNVSARGASQSSLNAQNNGNSYSQIDVEVYDLITSSADVIKGIFGADWHKFMYMEVDATKGVGGEATVIPQYVAAANQGGALNCVKITIK